MLSRDDDSWLLDWNLESLVTVDQLSEVSFLLFLLLDPLVEFLKISQKQLLFLMLLSCPHEELLIVAFSFDFLFIAKCWLLYQGMICLASQFQDCPGHRVVTILDLINGPFMKLGWCLKVGLLLFLSFSVSLPKLGLRLDYGLQSKSICDDYEAK